METIISFTRVRATSHNKYYLLKLITILAICILYLNCEAQLIPSCTTLDWGTTFINSFDCDAFEHGEWVQVWSDEFDEGELNTVEWKNRTPWGNYIDNYTFNQPENAILENSKLKIITKYEPGYYPVPYFDPDPPWGIFYPYTSDEVWTKRKYFYGKVEATCKISNSHGVVPAFWRYGECGDEIDIFEFAKAETGHHRMTIHHKPYCEAPQEASEQCHESDDYGIDFSTNFHVFSLEWDEFKIAFRVDGDIKRIDYKYQGLNGQEWYIWDCNNFPAGYYAVSPWFPDNPLGVIFGSGIPVTGDMFDPQYQEGPYPSYFEIENLKVYRRSNPNRDVLIDSYDNTFSSAITGRNITVAQNNNVTLEEEEFLTLIATENITLKPGFSANQGSIFEARINSTSKQNDLKNVQTDASSEILNTENSIDEKHRNPAVFPNPSSGKFFVSLSENKKVHEIEVVNSYGVLILDCISINNNFYIIDLSNYNSGIYYLRLICDESVNVRKLIKN
jgi:hypothetical protein